MNCSTYVFGELSRGYTQYPEDSSSNIFKEIESDCLAPTQLIVHRDENLMYYIYVRKLDKKKFIGLSVVINGYYLTRIQSLFSLFEKEIEKLTEKGVILHLNEEGDISSQLASLSDEEEEVISVVNTLQVKINSMARIKRLPPADFSVSVSSRKIFRETDPMTEIAEASCRFGFTVVLKEKDYDTIRLTSFKNILKNLNAEKFALIKENESLREVNRTIQRQKNNFKKVVFLSLVLVVCGVGAIFLYFSLNDANVQLDVARRTINEKDVKIENRDHRISTLRDSVKSLKEDVEREKSSNEKLESKLQTVMSYYPFAVTKCEVSNSRFKFDYYCTQEKEVTVTLKAINETSGEEVITGTYTLKFNEGTGSKELIYNNTLNGWCDYYVVLIYNGNVIAGKDW